MTAPVVDYYKKRGIFPAEFTSYTGIWAPIDAAQNQEAVWASLSAIFSSSQKDKMQPKEGGVLEALNLK
jgi:hypothetical protein